MAKHWAENNVARSSSLASCIVRPSAPPPLGWQWGGSQAAATTDGTSCEPRRLCTAAWTCVAGNAEWEQQQQPVSRCCCYKFSEPWASRLTHWSFFCQPDLMKCHPNKIRGGSSGTHGCFESLFDEVGLWKEELGMSQVKLNGSDQWKRLVCQLDNVTDVGGELNYAVLAVECSVIHSNHYEWVELLSKNIPWMQCQLLGSNWNGMRLAFLEN